MAAQAGRHVGAIVARSNDSAGAPAAGAHVVADRLPRQGVLDVVLISILTRAGVLRRPVNRLYGMPSGRAVVELFADAARISDAISDFGPASALP